MLNKYLSNGLLLAGIISVIVSCTTKKVIITEIPEIKPALPAELSVMEARWKKDFNTLKIKRIEGKLTLNGVSENVKGNMAVYRDSLIVISAVPALGYEMLRIMCTPDSIIVINRQEKSYKASSLDGYCEKYSIPINFYDLQAILSNEIFYYKDKTAGITYKTSIKTEGEKALYMLESYSQIEKLTDQTIQVTGEESALKGISVMDYEKRIRMDLIYEDFISVGNTFFPTLMGFKMVEKNKSIEMRFKYGQVVFNDHLNVEFTTPPSYKRTDI